MFTSAGHALDWAYNTSARPVVKISAINQMRQEYASGPDNALLLNLSPYDAHGQAAQIIGFVECLSDPAGQEYIRARFGRMLEAKDLTEVIYCGCEALGVGLDKSEAVYRVMRGYFGSSVSLRSMRRALECRHSYAVMSRNCLFDVLDIIHNHAMAEISAILERHDLIEVSKYA